MDFVADFMARRLVGEKGARAALVLLEENPLEDIDAVRFVSGVMVRGKWFDRDDLDHMPETGQIPGEDLPTVNNQPPDEENEPRVRRLCDQDLRQDLRSGSTVAANDLDTYWEFHKSQEYECNHAAHYAETSIS